MSALLYLAAGAVFTYVAVYYGWFRAARCTWTGTLSGKTAVVTGNMSHLRDAVSMRTYVSFRTNFPPENSNSNVQRVNIWI